MEAIGQGGKLQGQAIGVVVVMPARRGHLRQHAQVVAGLQELQLGVFGQVVAGRRLLCFAHGGFLCHRVQACVQARARCREARNR